MTQVTIVTAHGCHGPEEALGRIAFSMNGDASAISAFAAIVRTENMNVLIQGDQCMKPFKVSDVDVAFPASVKKLMPAMKDIPDEFHRGKAWSNRLVSDWFFNGVQNLQLEPKEGIDKAEAMRHIKCILGSFEPAHEDKEAACAYLLDLWFKPGTWDARKREAATG